MSGGLSMDGKEKGYDFDVCARLQNSTTIPLLSFSKFFSKNFKNLVVEGCFYELKCV